MSLSQQVQLDDAVLDHLLASSSPLPLQIQAALDRAAALDLASMQISPDQAVLLRFLVRLIGARRALEIGTFLGLSALMLAEGMGEDGTLVCLDQSEEWTAHARELWESAGVADRIDLRIGDAHESLRAMGSELFDVVFIDADKEGYVDYLDQVTPRLRVGGLLLVDNTLWYGRVADPDDQAVSTVALREFNRLLAGDIRYDVAMTAVGDGFTLARRVED